MRATITAVEMPPETGAGAFQRVCEIRYDSERRALTNGFIKPESPKPVETGPMYGMSYFGADRSTGRTFMGSLRLAGGQLTTVYLEGFNVDRKAFAESFQSLVGNL